MRRPTKSQRVHRLDHPGISLGPTGQEDVGLPIQQHDHPLRWDPLSPFLEAEIQTGGHPPHVPDLEVQDHQIRPVFTDGGQDLSPGVHPDHCVVATQGRIHLVVDVVGISGQQHSGVTHPAERTVGPRAGSRQEGGYRPGASTGGRRTRLHCKAHKKNPAATVGRAEEDPMLEISVERRDYYVVCRPAGELDAYTVAQFREALTELADESYVLVDLSDVPFMDSAGLGALIGGIRRARENDGDVAVACNRPALTRLLHTTGFDRIVPVRETVEEAVLALGEATD